MALATGLISSLFNVVSSQDVPTANASIMVLPKLTFVLLYAPFHLHYRIGDDIQVDAPWLHYETW